MTKGEKELLEGALLKAADAAAAIVEKGIEKAMNEYNVKPKKEKKAAEDAKVAEDAAGEVKND